MKDVCPDCAGSDFCCVDGKEVPCVNSSYHGVTVHLTKDDLKSVEQGEVIMKSVLFDILVFLHKEKG